MELIEKMQSRHVVTKVKKTTSKIGSAVFKSVFLIGFSFVILYPIFTMISKAFMERMDIFDNTVILVPKNFTLQNFQVAIMLTDFWEAMKNTVILSLIVMVLETISCLLVAYGLARFKFKLNGLILALVVFTIIVPPQLILTPMYVQFRLFDPLGLISIITGSPANLIDTPLPFALLSSTAMGVKNGLFILIFFQFFKNMPKEFEEASFIDGAGSLKTFFFVMLPNARTSIITVMLFGFLWQYNDMNYTSAFMQSSPVFSNVYYNLERFTAEVYELLGVSQYDITMSMYTPLVKSAGVLMMLAPLLIIFLICQRYFVESIERVGIVG